LERQVARELRENHFGNSGYFWIIQSFQRNPRARIGWLRAQKVFESFARAGLVALVQSRLRGEVGSLTFLCK